MNDTTSQSRFFAELKKQGWLHALVAIAIIVYRLEMIDLSTIRESLGFFIAVGFSALFFLPLLFIISVASALGAVLRNVPLSSFAYRRVFFVFALVFSIFFSIAFTAMSAPVLPYVFEEYRFDPMRWRNEGMDRGKQLSHRQYMLYDAIRTIQSLKSREKIKEALGEPSKEGYFESLHPDMLYYLGNERGFISIDSEWLLIWFDDAGNFERYRIMTD